MRRRPNRSLGVGNTPSPPAGARHTPRPGGRDQKSEGQSVVVIQRATRPLALGPSGASPPRRARKNGVHRIDPALRATPLAGVLGLWPRRPRLKIEGDEHQPGRWRPPRRTRSPFRLGVRLAVAHPCAACARVFLPCLPPHQPRTRSAGMLGLRPRCPRPRSWGRSVVPPHFAALGWRTRPTGSAPALGAG